MQKRSLIIAWVAIAAVAVTVVATGIERQREGRCAPWAGRWTGGCTYPAHTFPSR